MVCTSVIVADRYPLVVCRVNSTLGAETDSNIAASCGAAAKSKPSAIRDIKLVDTSMPGLSEHRRMKELEGGPKIADANASRYQRGRPAPRIAHDIQAKIGRQLRAMYDDVVNQGIPERLRSSSIASMRRVSFLVLSLKHLHCKCRPSCGASIVWATRKRQEMTSVRLKASIWVSPRLRNE
jgi:hypothetical protein